MLEALFAALKAMFDFGSKVTPPDTIRVQEAEIKKELKEERADLSENKVAVKKLKHAARIVKRLKLNPDDLVAHLKEDSIFGVLLKQRLSNKKPKK